MECPRSWSLEARLKLLGLVLLVYVFLLSSFDPVHHDLVEALLCLKCHRTGKRCQEIRVPLYRLRWVLSQLWTDERPRLTLFLPPPPAPQLLLHFQQLQKNWTRLANSRSDSSASLALRKQYA